MRTKRLEAAAGGSRHPMTIWGRRVVIRDRAPPNLTTRQLMTRMTRGEPRTSWSLRRRRSSTSRVKLSFWLSGGHAGVPDVGPTFPELAVKAGLAHAEIASGRHDDRLAARVGNPLGRREHVVHSRRRGDSRRH
jgi:hypothetical protein